MTGEHEAAEPAGRPGRPVEQEQQEAGAEHVESAGTGGAPSGAPAGDAGTGSRFGGTADERPASEEDAGESGEDLIDLSEIGEFLSGSGGLKEIAAERDEYLDSLRRLQADFDNYRKRAIRQQTELVERATEGLLMRLLPVLDALDLAMAHLPAAGAGTSSDSEAMRSLVQIGTLLRDVLEREGLERIDQVGVTFDPTIHDAVAEAGPDEDVEGDEPADAEGPVESDEPAGDPGKGRALRTAGGRHAPSRAGAGSAGDNSVADVMRSGYRLKGRVLRPAMVAVRAGSGSSRGRGPGPGGNDSGGDDN